MSEFESVERATLRRIDSKLMELYEIQSRSCSKCIQGDWNTPEGTACGLEESMKSLLDDFDPTVDSCSRFKRIPEALDEDSSKTSAG